MQQHKLGKNNGLCCCNVICKNDGCSLEIALILQQVRSDVKIERSNETRYCTSNCKHPFEKDYIYVNS